MFLSRNILLKLQEDLFHNEKFKLSNKCINICAIKILNLLKIIWLCFFSPFVLSTSIFLVFYCSANPFCII